MPSTSGYAKGQRTGRRDRKDWGHADKRTDRTHGTGNRIGKERGDRRHGVGQAEKKGQETGVGDKEKRGRCRKGGQETWEQGTWEQRGQVDKTGDREQREQLEKRTGYLRHGNWGKWRGLQDA